MKVVIPKPERDNCPANNVQPAIHGRRGGIRLLSIAAQAAPEETVVGIHHDDQQPDQQRKDNAMVNCCFRFNFMSLNF
jgi:hypothetical protein